MADLIKGKPPNTGQLPGELPLFIGMPIYISNNIATELGITNGTKGVVKAIHLHKGKLSAKKTLVFILLNSKTWIV